MSSALQGFFGGRMMVLLPEVYACRPVAHASLEFPAKPAAVWAVASSTGLLASQVASRPS